MSLCLSNLCICPHLELVDNFVLLLMTLVLSANSLHITSVVSLLHLFLYNNKRIHLGNCEVFKLISQKSIRRMDCATMNIFSN